MRQIDLQARHRIAKRVLIIDTKGRLRRHHNFMALRGLMRHVPRRQTQHLMRMHDLTAIDVTGEMTNAIAVRLLALAATVRTSMPVCEKCRMLRRSQRRPASKLSVTSASARLARARVPAALV